MAMKNLSVVALAIAVTIQAAAASSAWTEFVAYKAPVVAPEVQRFVIVLLMFTSRD